MKSLTSILKEYQNRFANNLQASDKRVMENKQEFIDILRVVSGRNRIFLWINIAMILIVFVGSIASIIYYINDLKAAATISGISGISLAGMIYYMTSLWRQIVGIDLAIAMADRLDAGTMPAIINSLLSVVSPENIKKNG